MLYFIWGFADPFNQGVKFIGISDGNFYIGFPGFCAALGAV